MTINGYSTVTSLSDDSAKPKSIIPDKTSAETGLVHFYKKDGQWQYVAGAEYEEKKESLPRLTFACRASISDFEAKEWPDLDAFASKLDSAPAAACTDSESGAQIDLSKPVYFVHMNVDDKIVKGLATEESVLAGSRRCEISPTIYYRLDKATS